MSSATMRAMTPQAVIHNVRFGLLANGDGCRPSDPDACRFAVASSSSTTHIPRSQKSRAFRPSSSQLSPPISSPVASPHPIVHHAIAAGNTQSLQGPCRHAGAVTATRPNMQTIVTTVPLTAHEALGEQLCQA